MSSALDDLRRHPLADQLVDDAVLHHDPAHRLEMTSLRSNLLLAAARAQRRVVLHSSAASRMSPALSNALSDVSGRWVVEDEGGQVWDGMTGAAVDLTRPLEEANDPAQIASHYLDTPPPDGTEVILTASVRHRVGLEARFLTLTESFARELGTPPAAYGPHEPADQPWIPQKLWSQLTHLPGAQRLYIRGDDATPMRGSVLARPTRYGIEEVVDITVYSGEKPMDLASAAHAALERATANLFVLFGVVLARPGYHDLLQRPYRRLDSVPLAVLIGAPGLRDYGGNRELLRDDFGALPLGRQRVGGLLIPLDGTPSEWTRVSQLASKLGVDAVPAHRVHSRG